jgi:GNAT superfamily N-acetyltransferase
MDRETSLRLQRRSLADFIRLLGASSPGARVHESDGVLGAVVPACPERGLINSVSYRDATGLAGALDDLETGYREAGITAWLVWAPDFDGEAITVLKDAGYRFDGAPAAMHADLGAVAEPDPSDLASIVAPCPPVPMRFYRARVDGETACVVGTMDHDDDLGIYFVSTVRDHRGRGLSSRLIGVALAEARERGLATTSLQASPMGESVYLRLGYETTFRLQLWERREPY